VTVSAEYLRDKAEKARTTPSFYPTYLRLHANVRAKSTAGLIRMADWNHQDQVQMVVPEQLEGGVCFGGMDLSSTTDLTAVVLLFPREDGAFDVLPRFWIPEGNVRAAPRRERARAPNRRGRHRRCRHPGGIRWSRRSPPGRMPMATNLALAGVQGDDARLRPPSGVIWRRMASA
jgi:phage terminase large subunit-like protein